MNFQYLTLIRRMADINGQMNALGSIIRDYATKKNPLAKISLFQNNPPDSIEVAAGLMVAAFGYEESIRIADAFGEKAVGQDIVVFQALAEFISEMLEVQRTSEGKFKLIQSDPDDLAAEPDEEDVESQQEKEKKGTQESFSLSVVLNEKQLVAEDFAKQGKSFCLIGPAGSGKTTAQRAVSKSLWNGGRLMSSSFRIGGAGLTAPSIAFCAFTRRAAGNLRKAIHKDPDLATVFAHNIMTVHALLEYAPETYMCPIENVEKFRFAPRCHAKNPLTITHLVIEEASQIGAYDLWQKLYDALPPNVQIIFIGDINQLPPAFGPSILNYALTTLPIVELTEVYRNQGVVLENAHNILNGRKLIEDDHFRIIRGNKPIQLGQERMSTVIYKLLQQMTEIIDEDDRLPSYDIENDMVLSVFNVQPMGTDNMNKWIAQFVGEKRGAVVHEIIAGRSKHYLAIGDKVMVNKRDGVIKDIMHNPDYHGRVPQLPGKDLSRFGHRIIGADSGLSLDDFGTNDDIDYSTFSLESLQKEDAERKQQASHIVVIDYDEGYTEEICNAGDFGDAVFSLGYVLTVYKAQGSEWRKIFLLMHKDQSVQLFRESFYTAITRARTKVDIIAKDYLIDKAIASPRIKGNTLKDKLAFFNSGINNTVDVQILKTE